MTDSNWLVSAVFETCPETMHIFKAWKLDCLGCEMAGFCTIADVAREYSLNLEQFLQDLNSIQHVTQDV